jgi:hypothetical protein
MRSGAPPPAICVASFWLYGPKVAYWVLTVMVGLAFSKRAMASWVALAREASPHQEKDSLTLPPESPEPPDPPPHAASESEATTVAATAMAWTGRRRAAWVRDLMSGAFREVLGDGSEWSGSAVPRGPRPVVPFRAGQ